jgi:site-specific DNA recombinase
MALAYHSTPTEITTEITALYLRISDDDGCDALGVARQHKDMLSHAERLGLPVEVFEDNSYSASRYARRKRPAYGEMVRRIEAGEIRHAVFWDLSRLVRQPKELEHLIDLAEVGTVEIHSMTGRIDLRDPDGRAMARVITTMNAKASDDSSKRIKRKQAEMREAGRFHGGGRAFGFEPTGGVVRRSEATLIVEAALRTLKGDGLTTIARDWNHRAVVAGLVGGEGIPAPSGRPWRPKTIRDALLRDLTVSAGILTADQQQEVRAVLMDPARGIGKTNSRSYLLSGLVTCGVCGARMRAQKRANGRPAYTCDAMGCRRVSSLGEPLDEYIRDYLLAGLAGPELGAAIQERTAIDPATSELTAAVDGYETRLAALEVDYMDGGLDLPTWKRMRAGLEVRIAEARRALARQTKHRALAELPTDLAALEAWWATASLDRRRAVITGALESITLGPGRRGIKTFDPDRVTFVWRS